MNGNEKNNSNKRFINIFFWIIILWILISLFFRTYQNMKRAEISYGTFKKQAAKGNIESAVFKGETIKGEFQSDFPKISENKKDTAKFNSYITVKPSIEDPELIKLLEDKGVNLGAERTDNSWWPYIFIFMLPWVILIGYSVYMGRKMNGKMNNMPGGGGLFGVGRSPAKKVSGEKAGFGFEAVAGLKNARRNLEEIVDFLKDPKKFTQLGAEIPRGVLLKGPPGTGKTLLARASAGEAGVPFFNISGSEFIEMFVGVGASRVRDMFKQAKKESPSIIFIDEIDSIGRSRGTGLGGGHDEREQTLNQILNEMDGFEKRESVVVMAATNRPDVLDTALTRPGRFDRQITLNLPDKEARKKILKIHTTNVPLSEDIDFSEIAARTPGFSGADLKNLVNEAALMAGRRNLDRTGPKEFEDAGDKILLGGKRDDMIDKEEKKIIACHEAGHTIVAWKLPGTDPVKKVTIIARGRALGATEQVPEKDLHNLSRDYLLNRLTVMLGGKAAEEIVLGRQTNGAAHDLKQATSVSRKMVCQWGMSEKLGPVTFSMGEEHMFLGRELSRSRDFSEKTAHLIDTEIREIVSGMKDRAGSIINENRALLEELIEELMRKETLEKEELKRYWKNKGRRISLLSLPAKKDIFRI